MRRLLAIAVALLALLASGCDIEPSDTGPREPAQPPLTGTEAAEKPAASPNAALRRVALAIGNWTDDGLDEAVERAAALSAGAATGALRRWGRTMHRSLEVAPTSVRSVAKVEAVVVRGSGPSRGGLIVTREQMSGGVVEGEGISYRVTLATIERGPDGWAVTRWEPQA